MKIITVTLNPCIDVNYKLDYPFECGKLNRVPNPKISYNGKGINVSRYLKELGKDSTTMVISSDDGLLDESLKKEGLNVVSIHVPGNLRRNTAILDSEGKETQINEPGLTVSEEKIKDFISFYKAELNYDGDKVVVISGSIPVGLTPDIYRKLCVIAKNSGAYVILDASGENLKKGIEAMPDLIKPNLEEFEELIGKKFNESGEKLRCEVYDEALQFYRKKYTAVLCTLGEDGAVIACGEGSFLCQARQTKINNFKGAGDTFLASYIYHHFVKEETSEQSLILSSILTSKYLEQ